MNLFATRASIIKSPSGPPVKLDAALVAYSTIPDIQDGTTTIALGEEVQVNFTHIGSLEAFYIDECTANNNLESDNVNYVMVQLIKNGCLVAKTVEPLTTIDPTLSANRKSYTFKQFGFVSDDPSQMSVTFNMVCRLRFGTAPGNNDCGDGNLARSSQDDTPSTTVQLEYDVSTGTVNTIITDGVVTAVTDESDSKQPDKAAKQLTGAGNSSHAPGLSFLMAFVLTRLL